MKVMIVSDSHSMSRDKLLAILKQQKVDYYLHCGDIYMTFDDLPLNNFYNVRGNNDNRSIKEELTLNIDGLNFWIVHGHKYNVDFNIEGLNDHIKDKNIDVVCFGHTHRPTYERENNVIFVNPGSLAYPRGRYPNPTYCIFDTSNKQVTFYDSKTNEVCDPFNIERKKVSIFDIFKRKN